EAAERPPDQLLLRFARVSQRLIGRGLREFRREPAGAEVGEEASPAGGARTQSILRVGTREAGVVEEAGVAQALQGIGDGGRGMLASNEALPEFALAPVAVRQQVQGGFARLPRRVRALERAKLFLRQRRPAFEPGPEDHFG